MTLNSRSASLVQTQQCHNLCVCVQEQIRHVRVTASEIEKLTPQLLSAADMACGRGDTSATTEHLNLLSQEWATKVCVTSLSFP